MQNFLQPTALPNTNLYHRSGKWIISCLLRQDDRSTILNLTEHSCVYNKISSGETLLIRRMFL